MTFYASSHSSFESANEEEEDEEEEEVQRDALEAVAVEALKTTVSQLTRKLAETMDALRDERERRRGAIEDAERRERTWTWTDGTDVGTRMVCDYGRAEAMASTTARGLARARAIDGGGSMDSGVEGATSRRRGRGGRGGGARVKGAIGVFVLGAALVKGAFGDYVDYVRMRSETCQCLPAPRRAFVF